jgi:hypothetical protein
MRVAGVAVVGLLCVWLASCGRAPTSDDGSNYHELVIGKWEPADDPGRATYPIEFTADGKYKGRGTRLYKVGNDKMIAFFDEDGERFGVPYQITVTKTELTLTLGEIVERYKRAK